MKRQRATDPLAGLPWVAIAHADYDSPRFRKLTLAQRGVFLSLVAWAQTIPQRPAFLEDGLRVLWGITAHDMLDYFGCRERDIKPAIAKLVQHGWVHVLDEHGRGTAASVDDYFDPHRSAGGGGPLSGGGRG